MMPSRPICKYHYTVSISLWDSWRIENEYLLLLGCDGTFCGVYWHAQRITTSEFYPVCNLETLRPDLCQD
ncbi:hypothetical protein V6N13_126652 [Hibiscus sabdariffa]